MKILLLVTSAGYSFTVQAQALRAALVEAGVTVELLIVNHDQPDYSRYADYLIIPIGAWNDYEQIVVPPLTAGCKVLPWLVADAKVERYIAEFNNLPQLLTTSEYAKSIFVRDGVHADKIKVLYECVDQDVWQPPTADQLELALQMLSIDDDARGDQLPSSFGLRAAKTNHIPILFTMGKPTAKGSLEIMQALAGIDPTIPWIYILKGWPSPTDFADGKTELELADKLGIGPRVRYISGAFGGPFMHLLMQVCDIYIAAAHSESFGLPLVEAQLCGKMVITHAATSNKETVTNNVTGLIAHSTMDGQTPKADIKSLQTQLTTVLTNNTLRQQLSSQARETVINRFGKAAIAKQFMALAEAFLHG